MPPPTDLAHKHLHTIPHGVSLPDPNAVEDGYPFLLEDGGGNRVLWQNQNGVWVALYSVPVGGTAGQVLAKTDGTDGNLAWVDGGSGGGAAVPSSWDGTQWGFVVDSLGELTTEPIQAGAWVLVDNFQVAGNPAYPPWSRPIGSMVVDTGSTGGVPWYEGAVVSPDNADTLIHHDMGVSSFGQPIGVVRAHATVVALPATGQTMELFVRGDSQGVVADGYYAARVTSAGVLQLVERVSGADTVVDTHPSTVVAGDVVHITAYNYNLMLSLTHIPSGNKKSETTVSTTPFAGGAGNTLTAVGIRMTGGAWNRYAVKDLSSAADPTTFP